MFLWNRLVDWSRREIHKLVRLHDTPHSIAGGTAVGMFMGFTPFLGMKTVLGMAVAMALRCSPVAVVIVVALQNLTLPFIPVLLCIEYAIGYWLLSHPHHWPQEITVEHMRPDQWLHWSIFVEVVWPTFLGSIVVGGPVAAASFWVMLRVVRKVQAARARRHQEG